MILYIFTLGVFIIEEVVVPNGWLSSLETSPERLARSTSLPKVTSGEVTDVLRNQFRQSVRIRIRSTISYVSIALSRAIQNLGFIVRVLQCNKLGKHCYASIWVTDGSL